MRCPITLLTRSSRKIRMWKSYGWKHSKKSGTMMKSKIKIGRIAVSKILSMGKTNCKYE